ncbi:MAG: HAD family phosphatase [Bacteroidia bacterium]|nr:HAD family phosphatase [Bacteroidia bacterium]
MLAHNTPHIKAVVLDFGAVLININYQLTIDAFKQLGITNFEALYSKAQQTNLFNDLETGVISDLDFYNGIRTLCRTQLSNEQIQHAWNAMLLNLPKYRIDFVYTLKQRYNVYLLSNTNCIHEQAFMLHIRTTVGQDYFNDAFNKIFYSHEIGLRKPNSNVFEYVQKHINVNANQILFVDDSPQHIQGALQCGWKTHHLLNTEEITEVLCNL